MITQSVETHQKRKIFSAASLKKLSMAKQPRKMTMGRSLLTVSPIVETIKQADLDAAIEESLSREIDLETLLLDKYRVPKAALGLALSEFYQCPYVSYDERTVIDPELLKNLSFDYLIRSAWIPLKRQGTVLDIVINDPHDLEKGLDIRRAFPGTTFRFSVGLRRDIEQYLLVATGQANGGSITEILGELVDEAGIERNGEKPVEVDENPPPSCGWPIRSSRKPTGWGVRRAYRTVFRTERKKRRFRVDGSCFTYMRLPAVYRRAIVSRLKIANGHCRAAPQDGKIRYKLAKDCEIELRVATLPTGNNEDVVLRL